LQQPIGTFVVKEPAWLWLKYLPCGADAAVVTGVEIYVCKKYSIFH
jgi:hypothetical protein